LGVENSVEFSKVDGEQLGEIVALIVEGTISNTMAKQLLKVLHNEDIGKKARQVAKERGFKLITDKEELAKICHDIISTSPEEMERYNMGGKYAPKIKKFLLGKAMAATRGNAHPERLNEILMEVLEEIEPDVN
jgi:aspartyl-tRNA(Asn)/glutamyl-tRNA(Gln) amidotransferase subunit B